MLIATQTPLTISIPHVIYLQTAFQGFLPAGSIEILKSLKVGSFPKTNVNTKRTVFAAPFPCSDQYTARADSDIFLAFVAAMLADEEYFRDHFVDDQTLIMDSTQVEFDFDGKIEKAYLALGMKLIDEKIMPCLTRIPTDPPVNFQKYRCVYVSLL